VRAKGPLAAEAGPPPRAKEPLPSRWGIGLGDRVRVVAGPFSGKVGVVQELDAKGGARVMLGLLVVRFEFENLTPQADGRARPVLGSSHRKPIPARS
jgi:transcription antitermination factor NusG